MGEGQGAVGGSKVRQVKSGGQVNCIPTFPDINQFNLVIKSILTGRKMILDI